MKWDCCPTCQSHIKLVKNKNGSADCPQCGFHIKVNKRKPGEKLY